MTFLSYIGLIGGVCSLAGYGPYVRNILRGKSQPERASWLIWTLSGCLILLSSWEIGARTTIWVPLAFVIGSTVITILSFIFGKEGWGRLEKLALVVAAISSVRWIYFDQPFFTLAATMAIGFMGYVPDMIKLARGKAKAGEADIEIWTLFFMGSAFNLIAVSPWTPFIAAVPVALFAMNGLMFFLVFRSSLAQDREDSQGQNP